MIVPRETNYYNFRASCGANSPPQSHTQTVVPTVIAQTSELYEFLCVQHTELM